MLGPLRVGLHTYFLEPVGGKSAWYIDTNLPKAKSINRELFDEDSARNLYRVRTTQRTKFPAIPGPMVIKQVLGNFLSLNIMVSAVNCLPQGPYHFRNT